MVMNESTENYLETILVLNHRLGNVRSVDIANEMNFKKPSVSVAMKNLLENGCAPIKSRCNTIHLLLFYLSYLSKYLITRSNSTPQGAITSLPSANTTRYA